MNFLIRTGAFLLPQIGSIWLESTPKEKSLVMEKIVLVATTRTQKTTSNTFDSRIIKFFKAIVFISPYKKLHKGVEYKRKGHTRFTARLERDRERTKI